QRLLIDSQKNQVVVRRSFPALLAQQILETLFASPRHRDEWQRREKVAGKNHHRPKQTNCGKSQTTMACEPVHSKILENCTGTANPKGDIGVPANRMPVRLGPLQPAWPPLQVLAMDAELLCPACRIPLTKMRTGTGIIWRCEKCDGRAVGLQLLRRTFTPESINPLWLHAIHNEGSSARSCPSCGNPMIEVALDSSSGIKVEVCKICEFVWFDKGETETLQVRPPPKPPPALLPQKAREAIALARVQQLAEQARGTDFDSAPPDEWWKSIAAFLGMPVEFDAPAEERR